MQCADCGHEVEDTCPMCGHPICAKHFDGMNGICLACPDRAERAKKKYEEIVTA